MAEAPSRAGTPVLSSGTANTATQVCTGGGASTWLIVRELLVCNETNGPVKFSLGINTAATDVAGKRFVKDYTLQPGDPPFNFGGMICLIGAASNPDQIYVICDTASGVTVTASGVTGP